MKKRSGAVGIAIALVAVVGAVAYWTGSGSGTGSGNVGSGDGLTLHGVVTDGVSPGTSVPVSFTADNANTSAITLTTIHLDSVTSDNALCDTSDFTMADVVENQSIAASSTGVAVTNGGTLAYANTAVNQDACKNATLTLTLSSV
jgi:hypothetical protein